jgi:predicted O-methyltransferase YrrM
MGRVILEKIFRNLREPKKLLISVGLRLVAFSMSCDSVVLKPIGWVYGSLKRVELKEIFPGIEEGTVTLVRTYDRDEHTSVTLAEIAALSSIIKHTKVRNIFEIGTYQGNTTLQLAANSPGDAKITTLDLPPRWNEDRRAIMTPEIFKNVTDRMTVGVQYKETPYADKIKQVFADSANMNWSQLPGPFDFIFIDGCHYYEYVKKDTENALRVLRPGGIIVWHDYGMIKDVSRAVDETSKKLQIYAISGTRLAVGLLKNNSLL